MFEFDKTKSDLNKQKHGIDFVEAQALWNDLNLREAPAPADTGEERWIVIGMIERKHWTAVVAYREEKTRLISVRRARKEEIKRYEENNSERF